MLCHHSQHPYAGCVAEQRFLYRRTADAIRRQIATGELAPGAQVGPSIPVMAAQYGVGQGTMRSALRLLAAQGLVETRQGKDTIVTGTADQAAAAETDVRELARQLAELREEVRHLEARLMELYERALGEDYHKKQERARK